MVLNISKSEFPLEVIKIESGSLFAKLFGNANVIKLLGKFIESGASYVYRNFTNEGKLQSIPRKVETIESIIKLRETLISSGIEVDQKMEDHIKKSSVAISKELNNLISGEGEIIVNDTKISIGEEVQKKLTDERGLLKLEHSES